MFGAPSYDFTEASLHLPISVEELDAFLNAQGRPFSRHRRMRHLLWRMRTTLDTAQGDIKNLKRQVEKLSITQRERVGTPTTLSPVDALRYASPEELEQAVNRIHRAQLADLRRLVTEWKQWREAMTSDVARVRAAATDMINRPDLPAGVRAEFARLLAQTPEPPPDREVPNVLRLADDIRAQLPAAPTASAAPHVPASPPALPAPPSPGTQPGTAGPARFTAPTGFTPPAQH